MKRGRGKGGRGCIHSFRLFSKVYLSPFHYGQEEKIFATFTPFYINNFRRTWSEILRLNHSAVDASFEGVFGEIAQSADHRLAVRTHN